MSTETDRYLLRGPLNNGTTVSLFFPLPPTLIGDSLAREIQVALARPCRVIQIADLVVEVRAQTLTEADRVVIQGIINGHSPQTIGATQYNIRADGVMTSRVRWITRDPPNLVMCSIQGTVSPLTTAEIAPDARGRVFLDVLSDVPQKLTITIGEKSVVIEAHDPTKYDLYFSRD